MQFLILNEVLLFESISLNSIQLKRRKFPFISTSVTFAVARWKEWMNLDCLIWSLEERVSWVKLFVHFFLFLFFIQFCRSFILLRLVCLVRILVLLPMSHYTSDKCYQTDLHRIKHRHLSRLHIKKFCCLFHLLYILSSTSLTSAHEKRSQVRLNTFTSKDINSHVLSSIEREVRPNQCYVQHESHKINNLCCFN